MTTETPARPDVKICDVSLRDGMQVLNRHAVIPLDERLQLLEALIRARVPYIEVGSFVNARVVPAMADTRELLAAMPAYRGQIACLVPSVKYYELFSAAPRVNTVALFVSASEDYAQKNTRMSVDEAVDRAGEVARLARADGHQLRGYVSFAFRDPAMPDELTPLDLVERITRRLVEMGCEAVALSDTDGLSSPRHLERTIRHVRDRIGLDNVAVHLHDRRGLGITNAYAAYQEGIRIFDSSIGGIGGAITVRHSIGNIATEELVSMFDSMGVETGVDVEPLIEAGCRISQMADFVGDPPPPSRVILDELTKRRAEAEDTEGIEADLSLRDLVSSLLQIVAERPRKLSVESVSHTLTDAGKQVNRFLNAPTNWRAILASLMLTAAVTAVGSLVIRFFPSGWGERSEVIAITIFSLLMVLFFGGGMTLILARGLKLPRRLSEPERALVREAVSASFEGIDQMFVRSQSGGNDGKR